MEATDFRSKKTDESEVLLLCLNDCFQTIQPVGRKVVKMTIRELMELVDVAMEDTLPTAKSLMSSGVDVVLEQTVEIDTTVKVYRNGYVACSIGKHVTVFPLHSISETYGYEDICSHDRVNTVSCQDMDCVARLLLEGYDRIDRNCETCYSRKKVSYSAEAEDWSVLADRKDYETDSVNKLFVQELLNLLTDRQKEYIIKYFFEEMQMPEIAAELGISKQAVADGIRLALAKMKKAAGK